VSLSTFELSSARLIALHAAIQTLGEEYTDIWQQSTSTARVPSRLARLALILLPTLPPYLLSKYDSALVSWSPQLAPFLHALPTTFDIVAEVNLAIFYMRGAYYDVTKRILGIRHVCLVYHRVLLQLICRLSCRQCRRILIRGHPHIPF
jgi:hypothetical protein